MRSECSRTWICNLLVPMALMVLWTLGPAAVASADTRDCTPTADEIALFRDEDFRGPCVVKGIGEHPNFDSGFSRGGGSSVRIGANVEALICLNDNFRYDCSFIYADSQTRRGEWAGHYPRSLIVRQRNQAPECRPGDAQVAVWNYQYFFGRCQVVNVGVYPFAREPLLAGSVRVGTNVEARLCTRDTFEGDCVILTPGYYSHWNFLRPGRVTVHSSVNALQVRRRDEPPACVPGSNQVALFQYGHFVGRCRLFGTGDYSRDETSRWADYKIHSIQVGDNVEAVVCRQRGAGPRQCRNAITQEIRELDLDSFSLSVQRRGQNDSDRSSNRQPPPPVGVEYTLWLAPNQFFAGFPSWSGRFPTMGRLDGNLTRVANPRNSVWLGFLKPGYSSSDCGDSNAYVLLRPGETMTDDQMNTIFGSRRPPLPVQLTVCSGAAGESTAGGGLRFPSLPLNITYTRR